MPTTLNPRQVNEDTLQDADNNTKVQVEKVANENKIRFDTAGVERMIINASGQVGIGTNDPDNTLHVKSAGTTHIKIESDAGSYPALKLKSGTAGSTYVWTPADTSDLRLYAGGADRVHIDNDGNVGIGTTNPGYNLHVAGAASAVILVDGAAGADAFLRFGQAGTLKSYIKQGSGGNLVMTNQTADKDIIFNIKDNTTEREGLRLNGDVAEVVINAGSDSLVDFRVESDSNTHMLFVDGSSNNVGIGTPAPSTILSINGPVATAISTKTANYTVTASDSTILANATSGSVVITLPAVAACSGRIYTVKCTGKGEGHAMNVSSNASETIDGSTNDTILDALGAVTLQSDGSGWHKIAEIVPPAGPPP